VGPVPPEALAATKTSGDLLVALEAGVDSVESPLSSSGAGPMFDSIQDNDADSKGVTANGLAIDIVLELGAVSECFKKLLTYATKCT
jgi:hypothetical protein